MSGSKPSSKADRITLTMTQTNATGALAREAYADRPPLGKRPIPWPPGSRCHWGWTPVTTVTCVHPRHLYAGTRSQNMADCITRGRHNKPRGIAHSRARLTEADVRAIRRRRAGGEPVRLLGAAFGVHHATISRIARGIARSEVA